MINKVVKEAEIIGSSRETALSIYPDFFDKKYPHKFNDYFQKELMNLKTMENDGLLKINENNIMLTPLGEHFSPQIANVFDVYNDQEFYKRVI